MFDPIDEDWPKIHFGQNIRICFLRVES
jgi:hypothetical protein